MKIAIIGKGFLGTCIEKEAIKQGFTVVATKTRRNKNSEELDITKIKEIENFLSKHDPKFVINCAASTNIDFLEEHEEDAVKVNITGVKNLAISCSQKKIRLIHISTDSVFDGKNKNYSEEDVTNPLNVYANSKVLGEAEVKKIKNSLIVRTNFYGIDEDGKYFLNWILDSLKKGKKINGFTNVFFSPLDIHSLSKIIIELLTKKVSGTLHLSSCKSISKFEFILKISNFLKMDSIMILPINYDESMFKSKRPKNTTLDNKKSLEIIKTHIMTIDEWLKKNRSELFAYMEKPKYFVKNG